MALVRTDGDFMKMDIAGDSQLVRVLQGLICDENSATIAYSRVLDSLESRAEYSTIASRLREIMDDELQHTGSLIECITALDPNITAQYEKGGEGR